MPLGVLDGQAGVASLRALPAVAEVRAEVAPPLRPWLALHADLHLLQVRHVLRVQHARVLAFYVLGVLN